VGGWRFLTPLASGGGAARGTLSVPEAEVPPEGALVLADERCAIVRRGAAYAAYDLACPHLGCTAAATPEGFACPCHGSRFETDGRVSRGPADRSLRRLPLERRDGVLIVRRT
jgi:Rieske Fe-S protein